MNYNWQYQNWPKFEYDSSIIDGIVLEFALEIGELKGIAESLPENIKQETIVQIMISEAIKTSEIEGEFYSRQDVMSSIKKNLGIANVNSNNKNAQAVGKLMVDVRNSFQEKLTEISLKKWHKTLMEFNKNVLSGKYRDSEDAMQIISGTIGKETVHFEAPSANRVPNEMKNFVKWFADFKVKPNEIKQILIKTAISHLYFETIHPFEDGNGRIGRALAEKCLSQSLDLNLLISLSVTIDKNKKLYYNSLKKAQRTMEITDWIYYFSNLVLQAQKDTKQTVLFTLHKTKFLDVHKLRMNERQEKAIYKLFENEKFIGGMTAKKYVSINKVSRATATRDLQDLNLKNILIQKGEGRNVSYYPNLDF